MRLAVAALLVAAMTLAGMAKTPKECKHLRGHEYIECRHEQED